MQAMPACPHCGGDHAESVLFCPKTGKAILESLVPAGSVIEGKYRVVAPIASGGMGAIYEVEHVGFGKHFAMKLLLPDLAQNMEVTQRFEREAKAASAIGHPNIIEITDVGETESGLRFIVMELLRGQDLAGRLAAQLGGGGNRGGLPGAPGPRSGPRRGHHPPGSQAGERVPSPAAHRPGDGEAARFRDLQDRHHRRGQASPHLYRADSGDPLLHGAGAGQGLPGRGSPRRPLRGGGDPLRDPGGTAAHTARGT